MELVRRHRGSASSCWPTCWRGAPSRGAASFAPGALIAALVVAGVADGWSGLRDIGARLIRWRVSWVWYALAAAVPLGVHALAVTLNVGAGASAPTLDFLTPWYALPLALGMHIVSPMGGPLMEEPSRGTRSPSCSAPGHDSGRRPSWRWPSAAGTLRCSSWASSPPTRSASSPRWP